MSWSKAASFNRSPLVATEPVIYETLQSTTVTESDTTLQIQNLIIIILWPPVKVGTKKEELKDQEIESMNFEET